MRDLIHGVVSQYIANPLAKKVTNEIILAIYPTYTENIAASVKKLIEVAGDKEVEING